MRLLAIRDAEDGAALLVGNDTGSPISSSYNPTTVIKYDASKCVAADLSWKLRSSKGVSIVRVQPRPTPEERADTPVEIQVDDALAVHAAMIEDWVEPRQSWEFVLREGHDSGR